MEAEQSRWVYLNAEIRHAATGVPITGLDDATLIVRYKKNNQTSLTTKTFGSVSTVTTSAIMIGDTSINVDDASVFPISGTVLIDTGGDQETVTFSRVPGLDTLTISAAAKDHLSGVTVLLKDFFEIGFGVYSFLFTPTETNTLGNFLYIADPVDVNYLNYVSEVQVIVATSSETVSLPSLSTCKIYGHLALSDGTACVNESVSIRLIATPTDISNVGISVDVISEKTDSNGYFAIDVLQTAIVDISIPVINYRQTLTVPSADSADLFNLS